MVPTPDAFDPSLVHEEVTTALLADVSERVRALHAGLIAELHLGRASPAKIPEKVLVLTHALAHRMAELSRAYVREVNARSLTPSFLLARAMLEGGCLAYDLTLRIAEALKADSTSTLPDLDEHLTRVMHGAKSKKWRPNEDDPEAVNILTVLDRVARELGPAFRQNFEDMCEFAHPNAAGVLSSYGDLDTVRHIQTFDAEPARSMDGDRVVSWHLRTTVVALAVFSTAQTLRDHQMPRFISLCERELFEQGTWPRDVSYPRKPA